MKLTANAYAIGPGLHDWEREEWEEREIKRDARDEAFEKEYEWWHINLYCDKEKEKGKKEIIETMSVALNNLYCNDADCERFEFALFQWYCSGNNSMARNTMFELLDKHIRAVVRKEWNRERREDRS